MGNANSDGNGRDGDAPWRASRGIGESGRFLPVLRDVLSGALLLESVVLGVIYAVVSRAGNFCRNAFAAHAFSAHVRQAPPQPVSNLKYARIHEQPDAVTLAAGLRRLQYA
ncbi:hypothetical protein [Paraburkholderia sp. ZP32-5]|uniref:hypothetical protein n=1 Tax=Paraburkholderia sp. ZP32-5 TaxID=2883245 RepID=UPI001F411A48|nr:hypothetical protein [Paraburkholderia sp. ZP32-5]